VNDATNVHDAIQAYFKTQQTAAVIGGLISVVVLAAVIVMLLYGGDFLRGLAVVLGLSALLIGGSGVALAVRDHARIPVLLEGDSQVVIQETERMAAVVDSYVYYRIGFLGIAVLAGILLYFDLGSISNGVAVGLLLLAALGLTIDHFDRAGALHYLETLRVHHPKSA
jgi:hypothetical protein